MSNPPLRAGVIGWPVAHSLSPRLHGFWLDAYGIDGTYEAIPVAPDALAETVQKLARQGFAGLNVTVPHKQAVMAQTTSLSEAAARIGAVNTLTFDASGAVHGDNTDAFGFMENLRHGLDNFDPGQAPALVLGAGGAARAVVAALIDAGAPEVRIANRSREHAEKLAADMGGPVAVSDWAARNKAMAGAGLLVNTTALGMTGKPALAVDLAALPPTAAVNDIVYAPLETDLLRAARARGHPVVDGLGMLLHQARPAFKAFFGRDADVTEPLRRHVLAGLDP